MDNTVWNEVNSTLDLNGPILSFSEQPTGATGIGTTVGATGGASISFTGIATGVDPGTGYLSYQWYEENIGKLSNDTYTSGTASTGPVGTAATLTLSNLITPTDNQRKFYVEVDYVASAYGAGKSTGNAINEPLNSGIATATVTPLINIASQPAQGVQALIDENATISVSANLTDSYFADDITYQWYLNGEAVTDGTKTVTTTTTGSVPGTIEYTYTSDGSHTIPSDATNIEITLSSGSGGSGGDDAGDAGGSGGEARAGRFSIPNGERELQFKVGKKGNDGTSGNAEAGGSGGASSASSGGNGGGAGDSGWSGGGGGGGGTSAVYEVSPTARYLIVSAGAGGGGGGSDGWPGEDGHDGGQWESDTRMRDQGDARTTDDIVNEGLYGKVGGSPSPGVNGGGGGGGGGGVRPGSPGASGQDIADHGGSAAEGGGGGEARWNDSVATPIGEAVSDGTVQGWKTIGDGYINLKYTGTTEGEVTKTVNTTLSGTTSNTLTIQCDTVGVQTCQCKIVSATASNSPIWTDTANFVTTSTVDQNNVVVEAIGVGQTATVSYINLANGDYEFATTQSQVSTGSITNYYSFYSSEKDLDVEMELYGGRGIDFSDWPSNRMSSSWGAGEDGGQGGYSKIRFTMEQNVEYVIAGLSTNSINTPFLYRKGALIACVGQGGEGGHYGRGGFGGGVDVAGENGQGRLSGEGGLLIAEGQLTNNGIFGSLVYIHSSSTESGGITRPIVYPGDTRWVRTGTPSDSGRTIRCTKGVYWAEQGLGACDDISGNTKFRLPDGSLVTNTNSINRGFKAGYNIMETAAGGSGDGGNGGNGATGGTGGSSSGGGGGSGYTSGEVTIVDTTLGGSNGNAKVILRVVT